MRAMRMREEDLEYLDPESQQDRYVLKCVDDIGLGLYSACEECVDAHRIRVAAKMCINPGGVSNGMLC